MATTKRWTGSAFIDFTKLRRWTGSAWVDVGFGKRWSGSAWIDFWPPVVGPPPPGGAITATANPTAVEYTEVCIEYGVEPL
jgi:hypothetical protein